LLKLSLNRISTNVIGLFVLSLLCLANASIAKAQTSDLGAADYYNIYVIGNDTYTGGGDSQGAVAVGGNATFTQYSIADNLPSKSNQPNLVVGGTLNAIGATVNGNVYASTLNYADPSISGNAVGNNVDLSSYGTVGGNVDYQSSFIPTTTTISGSVVKTPYTSPINFSTTDTNLYNDSTVWSKLAPTAVTGYSYGGTTLTATGPASTYAVFDITGTQLNGENNLIINAPAGQTVLVDISGTSDTWGGGLSLSGGITDNDIIYNFYQATSLTISGIDVQGSILAPDAVVNFASGQAHGNLIAGTLFGDGEAHNSDNSTLNGDLFAGVLPNGGQLSAVPEPNAVAVIAIGLCSLFWMALLKRRSSRA
jgi:choice-of-anchor A domain-containing protein